MTIKSIMPAVTGSTSTFVRSDGTAATPGGGGGTLDTIPAPVASVDFAQQQALQFRIENRTSDPAAPAVGEIWLRTDL
jgi:hypothetical protein